MANRSYNKSRQRGGEPPEFSLFMSAVRALGITLVISCVLVLISSGIVCALPDPVSATDVAAWISLGVASFIGGVVAFLCNRSEPERTALISGGMLVCVLLLLAFVADSVSSPLWMLIGYAVVVLLHVIGARASVRVLGTKKR